jgi:hypothetical protein
VQLALNVQARYEPIVDENGNLSTSANILPNERKFEQPDPDSTPQQLIDLVSLAKDSKLTLWKRRILTLMKSGE